MPKFLCSSSALLRQLKQVAHVVRRNPVIPVLSNVLLAVTGNELRIIGSDLENTVAVSLPVEGGNGETWNICPPLKPLIEVLTNLPDQPITVELGPKESQMTVRAVASASDEEQGGATGGASYTFGCELGADYPRIPAARDEVRIVLPGHLLRTAIAYAGDTMSNDDFRPAMACLHVIADASGLCFQSTDGHQAIQYEVQAVKEPGYSFEGKEAKKLLLPKQSLAALKALVKSEDVVTITTQADWGHAQIQISTWGPQVTLRPVDERFPDLAAVIPSEFHGGILTLSRPAAQSMLRRLKPFADMCNRKVHLCLVGTGGQAKAFDEGEGIEAREPLPGTLSGGGLVKEIAFNIALLSNVLALLPGPRVRMHFVGPNKAAVLTSDGYEGLRYLLMPVAITQYA